MNYIEVEIRTTIIAHGFDSENKLIEEKVDEKDFIKKIIALERIRSISEKYLLISSQSGREMYCEYKGTLNSIKEKLMKIGASIA